MQLRGISGEDQGLNQLWGTAKRKGSRGDAPCAGAGAALAPAQVWAAAQRPPYAKRVSEQAPQAARVGNGSFAQLHRSDRLPPATQRNDLIRPRRARLPSPEGKAVPSADATSVSPTGFRSTHANQTKAVPVANNHRGQPFPVRSCHLRCFVPRPRGIFCIQPMICPERITVSSDQPSFRRGM